MNKKLLAGVTALSTIFSQFGLSAVAADYTENDLKAIVESQSDYELKNWLYDDFDGNGTKEAFAFFADDSSNFATEAYFVDSNGNATSLLEKAIPYWGSAEIFDLQDGKKAALFHRSHNGTISNYLFGVDDNSFFEYNISANNDYGVIERDGDVYNWIIYNAEGDFIEIGRESYSYDAKHNTFNLKSMNGEVFNGWGATTESNENGKLLVYSYAAVADETFVIPSELGGMDVSYFDLQFHFQSNSFTYDDEYENDYGKNVKKLVLPSKLEGLFYQAGSGIFTNFENLEEIEIDSSNKYYATKDGILYSKDMKTLVAYPNAKIGETLEIPEGVENIGETYGKSSFTGIERLKKVILPSTIKSISSFEAFANSGVSEVILPQGLETIEEQAFMGCENLKEVTIPKSVKNIGNFAFGSNTKEFRGEIRKTDLTIYGYKNSSAEEYAMENGINFVAFDEDVDSNFKYEENSDGTITITKYIGSETELTIPSEIDGKKVTAIGESIFDFFNGGNRTVKKLTIPGSIKTIGEAAFAGAYELEEVIIEDGVESIGGAAFGSCTKLKKITIPASVTEMGNSVFCWAYASDSPAVIDVEIHCYKDSAAYNYAIGNNSEKHIYKYVLLDAPTSDIDSSGSDSNNTESSASSESSAASSKTSSEKNGSNNSPKTDKQNTDTGNSAKTDNPNTGSVIGGGLGLAVLIGAALTLIKNRSSEK